MAFYTAGEGLSCHEPLICPECHGIAFIVSLEVGESRPGRQSNDPIRVDAVCCVACRHVMGADVEYLSPTRE